MSKAAAVKILGSEKQFGKATSRHIRLGDSTKTSYGARTIKNHVILGRDVGNSTVSLQLRLVIRIGQQETGSQEGKGKHMWQICSKPVRMTPKNHPLSLIERRLR